MYLLDTNACIEVLRNAGSPVRKHLEQHHPSEVFLCSIVTAELFYGARKSAHSAKNVSLIRSFCKPFIVLPFDDPCAEEYGTIRATLERTGSIIGAHDLLIAAIAKTHDLVLVTDNTNEFSRVNGLQLQNWIHEA